MPTTEEATLIWATQEFVTFNLKESEIVSVDFYDIVLFQGTQFAVCNVTITPEAQERILEDGNPGVVIDDYLYQEVNYDEVLSTIEKLENMDVIDKSELDAIYERWVNCGI